MSTSAYIRHMIRWHMRKRALPSYIRHDFRLKIFALLSLHLSILLSAALIFEAVLAEFNGNSQMLWKIAPRTTCPKPSEVYPESSIASTLIKIAFVIFVGGGLIFAVVALVCECFDISWRFSLKGHYVMTNVIAANTMLTCVSFFHGFHGFNLKEQQALLLGSPAITHFLQTLEILWATIVIAASMFLALSFRAQGQFEAFHELQEARGFKMWGITVFSYSISDAPALIILFSWFTAIRTIPCGSWVPMASFCMLFLFLLDADQLLRQSNLDDVKRIVVLLHSKLAVFLAYYLILAIFAAFFGDSVWAAAIADGLKVIVAFQFSLALRFAIFNVWPGPPQGENMLKAIQVVLNEVRAQVRNRVHPDPVGLPDDVPDPEEEGAV